MKRKKHIKVAKDSHRIFYMISMLLLVLASIIGSVLLVPFLIFFSEASVYMMVGIVGIVFGLIFSYLALDLKHLSRKVHIFHSLSIPVIAIINIYLMMNLTSSAAGRMGLGITHDPSKVALYYLCGFLLPYLFYALTRLSHKKKKR